MLCGVVTVNPSRPDATKEYWNMWSDRVYLGSVMGSLEGWLGVRSLRTLELRVMRQSRTATSIVEHISKLLAGNGPDADVAVVKKVVSKLQHASLQNESWVKEQMPGGYGPVFALWTSEEKFARALPSKLALFHHATSLGGVESLIEWRRMSDDKVDARLLRVSIGVEDGEDLREDLMEGFRKLAAEA